MILSLNDVQLTLPAASGAVTILRGIDVSFAASESVAIIGPSGSGKTSLLMICAGLLKPSSGKVLFGAQDITEWGEDALADLRRDQMGIVFQSFHLIPTMTALENVAIPMELAGLEDAREKARLALEQVRLGHRTSHYPAQLSGGEQQRVAIARALSMKPRIILADEPTGNLDQETGKAIMDLLFERVADQGCALALITHDPALASVCDRQVHVQDGKIV